MNTTASTGKHPKGLYLLFFTEMWERFSYYGMRAIFVLFMTKALIFDKSLASNIYGSYTGLVYLTPLIGGYMADRYWGNRRSIFVGGILMAIGQFLMFISGMLYSPMVMYLGLGFLIFGNGFFKPNISTMVGQLYPAGDKRVDSAFTIFYMGINLGAFFAPFVCGGFGDTGKPEDFKWGFLAACIGMIISIISFQVYKNKLLVSPEGHPVGAKPKHLLEDTGNAKAGVKSQITMGQVATWSFVAVVLFVIFKGLMGDLIGSFIYAACIAVPGLIISDKSLDKIEKQRIWVIYILSFFVIFFWSAFEQAGASLTFFAEEQTNRHMFGKEVPASFFQSINAVAIVIFAPVFALLWTWLGKRNAEPASPFKQAMGLFLLAVGYLVIAFGVKDIDPAAKVSMLWLVSLYMIHTFGELCLSPIGLSMVVKLAPLRFASLLMGVWFLSTATANKFAGDLSALYPEEVSVEKNVPAKQFTFTDSSDTTNQTKTVKADSAYLSMRKDTTAIWDVKLASDSYEKPKDKTFMEKFVNNLLGRDDSPRKDSVLAITQLPANGQHPTMFQKKQIKIGKDSTGAIVKEETLCEYHLNKAGDKLYVLREAKDDKDHTTMEVWDLKPKKPSFLGMKIENLYDFFMIFVVMAGIASIILFILSGRLLKMMHGLR